jgi:hypothetical protein
VKNDVVTPAQRALLSRWLPMNPDGARGLLMELFYPPLDAARVASVLSEVREQRAHFVGAPSLLVAPVPIHGALSPWQIAWLVVDREPTDAAAFAALRARLSWKSALDVFGALLLTSDSLEIAQRRAALASTLPSSTWLEGAHDNAPWAMWLLGASPLPTTSATGDLAVTAALSGRWHDVDKLLPKKVRRSYPRAVRIGPRELMHAQLLRASLENLFRHWGRETRDEWHDGIDVARRLPLLGLIAALAQVDPLALLYDQRRHNAHLLAPPPRTFTLPVDVDAAFAAFEAVLESARAHGGTHAREGGTADALSLRPTP